MIKKINSKELKQVKKGGGIIDKFVWWLFEPVPIERTGKALKNSFHGIN